MTEFSEEVSDDVSESEPESFTSDPAALSLEEYTEIFAEIEEQPNWRHTADKEMDYADGNQLDSELLQKQAELGIPPAIEDLIGPALLAIQGYEATIRSDWRVTANGQKGGRDVADALNFKLNQAERESKADRACSAAFRPQVACGMGWVEVSRESDPFKFPYRCSAVNRNEIHWDMSAREPDLSDARWLRRQRWLHPERVALAFPQHAEKIKETGRTGSMWWGDSAQQADGGNSTGFENAWNEGRAQTITEENWYNPTTKEICISEVWYRRWVSVLIIKTPDGRVVEYDEDNENHNIAVASGMVRPERATVARVRRGYWLGPHQLHDGPSPYSHPYFPYVPFFGFREDNTSIPYGYVRGMKYPQDSLNSGNSKLRWGMSVMRVERTKGAVDMTDAQLRRQVARPDADIVLDADQMARPGARFEVKRDYTLTAQHYQMLEENRASIERVSSITSGFIGRQGTATSGVQEQTQVEQSNQGLGHIMDNFRSSRTQMGELLMAMIIDDMGTGQQTVIVEGDAVTEDRTVVINSPEVDPDTGIHYLSNDLKRTRLKVALEDVPSTNSYRGQQLNAMSEAVKSLPSEYQAAVLPFMVALMDIPFQREVVEAIRKVQQNETPEQIEQRIQEAVQAALTKAGNEIKVRELELKERKAGSEIKGMDAKAVQIGVQAAFSAMQAGSQIAQMPAIAPIADAVMQGAGYQRPSPPGHDPNFPTSDVPQQAAMPEGQAPGVRENTSPQFPPVPQTPDAGMDGIETSETADNLP